MLRQPYRTLYTKNVTSTLSGSDTFTLPFSDFDSLHAKFIVASLQSGAANQLNVYVQTTDDGGATYYDCVAFGTATGAIANANALTAEIPVSSSGTYVGNITASAVSGYVGNVSGLPLLTNQVRVVWSYGTMTSTALANFTVSLSANNQASYS